MNQNISEYIIQMYRKEDLMRAYAFDLEKFGVQVINFFPISDKEKLTEVNYYEELMRKMKAEKIETSGHLSDVNEIVASLSQLHEKLKLSDKNYLSVYKKTQPYIEENLKHAQGKITDEIQICINGIYGFLLLKIEEREIKPEEQEMIDAFGDLLSLLSFKYDEIKVSN